MGNIKINAKQINNDNDDDDDDDYNSDDDVDDDVGQRKENKIINIVF